MKHPSAFSFLKVSVLTISFFCCICLIACNSSTGVISEQNEEDVTISAKDDSLKKQIVREEDYNDTSKHIVYISFDDGPQPGTMNCYHICEKLGIRATFFMIGLHAEEKSRVKWVDSIKNNSNFFLCNHSYSHAFRNKYSLYYSHPDSALADFEQGQKVLNIDKKIARFPGNNVWALNGRFRATNQTRALAHLMDSVGKYQVLGWDLEWMFEDNSVPIQSATTIINQMTATINGKENFTKRHTVLLAHDRMFEKQADADSLYKFLSYLKQNPKYVFETLDKYPGVK